MGARNNPMRGQIVTKTTHSGMPATPISERRPLIDIVEYVAVQAAEAGVPPKYYSTALALGCSRSCAERFQAELEGTRRLLIAIYGTAPAVRIL